MVLLASCPSSVFGVSVASAEGEGKGLLYDRILTRVFLPFSTTGLFLLLVLVPLLLLLLLLLVASPLS